MYSRITYAFVLIATLVGVLVGSCNDRLSARGAAAKNGVTGSPQPTALIRSSGEDPVSFAFPWIPSRYSSYFRGRSKLEVVDGKIKANGVDDADKFDVSIETYEMRISGGTARVYSVSILLPNRAQPSCIFIFDDKVPGSLLFSYESGQYDVKGFKAIAVDEADAIVVEEYDISDSPICCPRAFYRSRFVWDGKSFRLESRAKITNPSATR